METGFHQGIKTNITRIANIFGGFNCKFTRKLKRATTLEFATIEAIIFIH